jgi:hypothetical protein
MASVVFHKYDHSVVAEIVAFDKERYSSLCRFLDGLSATEANWSLPRYLFNTYLEVRGWRILKFRFAAYIDKDSAQYLSHNSLTCRVYGFVGHLDSALQYVLCNPSPSSLGTQPNPTVNVHGYGSPVVSPQGAASAQKSFDFMNIPTGGYNAPGSVPYPSQATNAGNVLSVHHSAGADSGHGVYAHTFSSSSSASMPSNSDYSGHPLPSAPLLAMSPTSSTPHYHFFGSHVPETHLGPVSGSVLLMDKDAVGFYLAFENAFCSFALKIFNVTIQETMIDSALNSPTPQQILNHPSTPHSFSGVGFKSSAQLSQTTNKSNVPLRVTFHGHNPKDVKNAALYLEKLNSSAIRTYQVFFPKVDAVKYKELNSYKTQHESVLRVIRSRALPDIAPDISSTTSNISSLGSNSKIRARSLSTSESRRDDDTNSSINELGSRSPANSEFDYNRFPLSDGVDIVDPLVTKGFVHINIKPPLHSRGLK